MDEETQRTRITRRRALAPEGALPMAETDFRHARALFEEPDAPELEGREGVGPPSGWASRRDWAADRWPSFA
ncbi:hypothetical protein ABT154_22190 [Streptomyces sp. NPDC001728]|uniref:hypothetical protein n=1 Tax=Streptomyces sp. NPDC001728 TaxID=3154396 RepID=UPI00332038CC